MTYLTCRRGHRLEGTGTGRVCWPCAEIREQKRRAAVLAKPPRLRATSLSARYKLYTELRRSERVFGKAFFDGTSLRGLYRAWQDWKTAERLYLLATEEIVP